MGLGSGIIPYWEIRVPTACAGPVVCFKLTVCSLVLLKCVHHLYLANFTILSPSGRRWGPSRNDTRGVCEGQLPCDSCQQGLIGLDGWMPRTETDLPLPLLCVSQTLIHPWLSYVVFPYWLWYPDAVGKTAQISIVGDGGQVWVPSSL